MAKVPANAHYLKQGIKFLQSTFDLPFYEDLLQARVQEQQFLVSYRLPLRQSWLAEAYSPDALPALLKQVHLVLADALLWTNLGEASFQSSLGNVGDFYARNHAAHRADWILTGEVQAHDRTLDTFKAAMVLALTTQIGLAATLLPRYTRYGNTELPLADSVGEAIASILQTAADPTLTTVNDVADHYVNSWCSDCLHFRNSSTLMDSGYCEWAQQSIPSYLSQPVRKDPFWRIFVTHPYLQSGIYNANERQEAADQYRDRVAQWFDTADQVTLDPMTLHLVEDMLHAAKSEDELQDTDTVLPRALRLMDFWHSGYLPPSGMTVDENPNLLTALEGLPDTVLPLVLSSLTVLPPQYLCVGFLDNDFLETEVATLQISTKSLRDVLLQAVPRRVLELLVLSFSEAGESVGVKLMQYLYEQASITFERLAVDYEGGQISWMFEPMPYHLMDIMYIHARLSAFVRDVTLETISRIRVEERSRKGR